jgi:hypothetical protein
MSEVIEKGIIVSQRKVIDLGDSKAVTLPSKWVEFRKWLGEEVTELISIADDMILLVPPEKKDKALKLLKKLEKEMKK